MCLCVWDSSSPYIPPLLFFSFFFAKIREEVLYQKRAVKTTPFGKRCLPFTLFRFQRNPRN